MDFERNSAREAFPKFADSEMEKPNMTRILVTGGNGGLGRKLTPRLLEAGYTVRVMSRQPRPAKGSFNFREGLEWAQADIETGVGLGEAVSGADIIIHAATSPFKREKQVDVEGTRRVLEAARSANVRHVIHVSIVGIERIPMPYYRAKVEAEAIVRSGGVPFTILRATQFHSLIDAMLQPVRSLPIAFLPTDLKFQTIDAGEVAGRLCAIAGTQAAGLLPDMGGPEVLTLGEMAKAWFAAQGRRPLLLHLPIPGGAARAIRSGCNTCSDHRDGKLTWGEWVRRRIRRSLIREETRRVTTEIP